MTHDVSSLSPRAAAWPSVNTLAAPLLQRLLTAADPLGLHVHRDASGVRIVDAGIAARGSVEAGRLIAEICMGGLGAVAPGPGPHAGEAEVQVRSDQPVLACLGSQYAGWNLAATAQDTGGQAYFALGSGPARALAGKEPLFEDLGYRDQAEAGVLVLEVDTPPPPYVIDKVLRDCGLAPDGLTLILTPTTSLAGTTQVVARVLEVALHKAHQLGYALSDIVAGSGSAPLPAPSADRAIAMGRTNDAILYGGQVHLSVRGSAEAARTLAQRLPSSTSRDYGRSFAELYAAAGHDFYKIDGALFAPAAVTVHHLDSDQTWQAGALNPTLLRSLRS